MKLQLGEKKDKYLGLARELKKLWNMKETVRNSKEFEYYIYQPLCSGRIWHKVNF